MHQRYIIDNILSGEELMWIYHRLIETPTWYLSRTSSGTGRNLLPFMGFPGLNIENEGVIDNEFLSGYFRSIIFRVRHRLKREFSIQIPEEVLRIHVGAKSSFSKTKFHTDSDETDHWTILGFLNPVWNAKDGGEFYLADEMIEYKAGRFIIFPSMIKHNGGYVVNETLSYWRVAINIILGSSNPNRLTTKE